MMRSWAVFDSPIQDGLHTLKYRSNKGIGEPFAMQIAGYLQSLKWDLDVIVPVPLGRKRMQERGYNQVALVAEPATGAVRLAQAMGAEEETNSA